MADPPATIQGLFWASVAAHPDSVAQRWHDGTQWTSRTYKQLGDSVAAVAHSLLALGIKPGDRVALWSRNCPEWAEVDFAALTIGAATVPIYDTLTGEKGAAILNHSGARVLFVQAATFDRVAQVRSTLTSVEHIIVLGGPADPEFVAYADVKAKGAPLAAKAPGRLEALRAAITPDSLASIVYTSGTTAEPKGAMLTHGNFASNTLAAVSCITLGPEDVFLSFLPLSHVLERMAGHFAPYTVGAQVVLARSIDTLVDDMAVAKPTIMISVPRLYEKMHARMQEAIRKYGRLKRMLVARAIAVGMAANVYRQAERPIPKPLARRLARFDRLVFRKFRERVGGRLRFFVSGGAPLSRDIEAFFWAVGIPILQGYGLTETAPVTNVNRPGMIRFGSVGRPVTGVDVRIDTTAWDSDGKPHAEGEILVKGPNVMVGYWDNPKATREAIDKTGYFHTGDIGYLDADGFLFITDRKKEILVMSNGKKVSPQTIEGELKLQPHIAQAMVLGDNRNYIAALIVPDWQALDAFALAGGIPAQDRSRLVADPRIVSLFESQVEAVNAKLSRYEQVKKFWLVPQEWSVETGELTPTLKLKRRIIEDRLKDTIKRLYARGEAPEMAVV